MEAVTAFYEGMPQEHRIIFSVVLGVVLYAIVKLVTGGGGGKKRAPVMSKTEWTPFPLIKRVDVSHNTALFRFGLPNADDELGLPVGQHISLKCPGEDGKDVTRSYTPVSGEHDKGSFDLIVKIYQKGVMGQHLDNLKVGDTVDVRGPKGRFKYTRGMCRAIGMLAGGSGITPMYQIAKHILEDPADKTKVQLIFANVNANDILIQDRLDALVAKNPQQFSCYYVLNNPPDEWTGGVGFVSGAMIEANLPAPADDIKVLMCGPPPMNKAMTKILREDMGYAKETTFIF